MNPKGVIIHHSLTKDGQTVSWGAIREYHININGWRDIGYHYGLELVGGRYEIFKGRMDNEQGAHCFGFNDYLGICLIGNFNIAPPPAEQAAQAVKLCRSLMDIYGFKIDNFIGHWETFDLRNMAIQKSCPGTKFNMPDFRASL